MLVCLWCGREMASADSCTVAAFHVAGRAFEMVAYGAEPGGGAVRPRCGGCGVARGGHHHPGCDWQRCPSCRGQMITCGCLFDEDVPDEASINAGEPLMVDRDGLLVERRSMGGHRRARRHRPGGVRQHSGRPSGHPAATRASSNSSAGMGVCSRHVMAMGRLPWCCT